MRKLALGIAITLLASSWADAQFTQQGNKLVGTGSVGHAGQGSSVAISGDGTTAIVGGIFDNSSVGASWVFTRSSGVWLQQGSKLVGTGVVGAAWQGRSVAISADGNTAIVGGDNDIGGLGAAWVFTRSGGVWSQQYLLSGSGAIGAAYQGSSVAISADGNTALVGGKYDNSNAGATWVYTRSGGVWSQQGSKLVGTGSVGAAKQGSKVAISADGNTAIISGFNDNSNAGAAWVFTRSGGVWSQQGSKLVGTGAVGTAMQGHSVAISADGNTAIVGGYEDNSLVGATWVFTRGGGVWSQQGNKLVGTGAVGHAWQGTSVAISANGNTAIVGGDADSSGRGAAWVFTRSGGVWSQQGSKLVGTGAVGYAWQGSSVAISADGTTAIIGGDSDSGTDGAAWVFVATGGCTSPSITTQPQSQSIQSGHTATLSVSATGTASLSYQWYQGASGGTSSPVGTNASSFTTPALTATTSYWVRVSNACGNADSAAAMITVGTVTTNVVWVPVAAHNPGLKQSQWRSDLGLLNTGAVTANVQITFYGVSGTTSNTTYVPAGVQSILIDVVGQLGGSGQGALGIVSDQPLKVTSRTYNQVAPDASCYPNGTQGQDYPSLTPSGGLSASQVAWLPQLTENGAYRSNIGLVNCGSTAAAVTVELYNGAGSSLTSYTVSLNPGEWKQETQPFKNKAGQTAMDRGSAKVTVTSGSGVCAFASVVDNITNDPTTITMQR
jgi:hypothetical protein